MVAHKHTLVGKAASGLFDGVEHNSSPETNMIAQPFDWRPDGAGGDTAYVTGKPVGDAWRSFLIEENWCASMRGPDQLEDHSTFRPGFSDQFSARAYVEQRAREEAAGQLSKPAEGRAD